MTDETPSDPWAPWRTRIHAARTRRDDVVGEWQQNVSARRGSTGRRTDPLETARTSGRVSVNQDWPLTKAKIAQLYSQTPEVRLTPRAGYESFAPAMYAFGQELNNAITDEAVGTTIEEVLADVVNASGIGAVIVSCQQRTEPRDVPVMDPATVPPDLQAEIPMETVEHTVDLQHLVERISPADLLIPSDFTGSNYDKARWLGYDGRMTWAQAQSALGLTDEVKEKVLGADPRGGSTGTNSLNVDTTKFRDTDVVQYAQIFYWRHFYHADETSFKALQRVVFVDGLDDPVVNEPYAAQQRQPDGMMAGVTKNPIRVLTLTYISDDSFPPSDSSIVRPQVEELQESRTDMQLQRKHSIPIRWYDTSRISGGTRALLEKGTFQGWLPTMGPGDRAAGEVAQASFPPEKFEFDRIVKNEITETAQIGTNQAGAFASGERSAREASIVERNFQRRVGQEQDKVTRFFIGIAEVLGGHLAIYGTFAVPDQLGSQRALMANAFTYSVRVDATVRLDADAQIDRLMKGLNLTAQSGFVNLKPVIAKIWELLGEDPSQVVIDPKPKGPEPVAISINNADEWMNPFALAAAMRTQQAGSPEDVANATRMIQEVLAMIGSGQLPAPPSKHPPATDPGVERPEPAHANWDTAPRIERRAADGGA